MKYYLRVTSIFVAILLFFSGCAYSGGVASKEFGPAMLRLSSAVQGVAERPEDYGFTPGGTGEECIHLAVEDDPGLLTPFEGYILKAKCESLQAVVLLCDSQGRNVLMEDAGCTAQLDSRAEGILRACSFSLETTQVCK
ncbi:hypothetical protein [Geopsychrobacter electrodiphilus]|uniref:hypothetical protein n=1 Tax=Geopsychrobacter electrodiphilus TaxID=225196 RepID=UPI00035C7C39|nr:hypothetical protein [Geopsychrobacter electrodiphilus]